MTAFPDEFYRDILEGLAVYADSSFHRDILTALTRHQEPAIAVALNKNQMASKRWLADLLHETVGSSLGHVLILGGWVGALGAVLLHDRRFDIAHGNGLRSGRAVPRCDRRGPSNCSDANRISGAERSTMATQPVDSYQRAVLFDGRRARSYDCAR